MKTAPAAMRRLRRAALPTLLIAALLSFLAAQRLTEAPAARADFAPAPVILDFDGRRYGADGLRRRLQAQRASRDERDGTLILLAPRFSRREADGGRWELRAQRAELKGETLRLHGRAQARRLQPDATELEALGERMEWAPQTPLRAEGAPARFYFRSQRPAQGAAARLSFDPRDRRLRLEGGAELERADGVVRGESLEYFVRGQELR